MLRIAVVLLALLLAALPSAAQTPEDCSPESYAAAFALIAGTISAVEPGRLDRTVGALVTVLQNQRAQCAGLAFEGDEGGQVVGPFQLPAGTWIYEGQFNDLAVTTITTLTPECAAGLVGSGLASNVRTPRTTQAVIRVETDCRLLIEVVTLKPWQLSFIRAD